MPRTIATIHHVDRRRDIFAMPYAPAIVVRRERVLFGATPPSTTATRIARMIDLPL